MYDFYFGEPDEILANEEKYLLFIKRMLPRWVNGIPDSEYLAIFDILKKIDLESKPPVLVETGSGASSIVMFYFAVKYNGKLYTWDINGSKGSFLRSIANDTICKSFSVALHKHWDFIAYSSTNEHLGIKILKELNQKIDFCFIDSYHTLDNVLSELELIVSNMNYQAFVAIDDGSYTNKSENYSYINMFRKKLGLEPVLEPPGNKCKEYYIEVERFLRKHFTNVEKIKDSYKQTYQDDLFFSYYQIDKNVMNKMGMEKLEKLEHRFDSWVVNNK